MPEVEIGLGEGLGEIAVVEIAAGEVPQQRKLDLLEGAIAVVTEADGPGEAECEPPNEFPIDAHVTRSVVVRIDLTAG